MKFCWTTIMVNNMEESLKFYQEIVGLGINRRSPGGPGMELAFLGDGETQVELICDKSKYGVNIGKDISLGFEVDSLDEMMKFIIERGMGIYSGPFQPNPHIKFFNVLDPNGVRIQFLERM